MNNDLSVRARELALLFTSWASVTGSLGEVAFPSLLVERLSTFDSAAVVPLNDGTDRANVIAFKRGRSRKTIVLTGHFDTVPFDDYAEFAEYALLPEKLTAAIAAKLNSTGSHPLALADFESGDFIAGRGLLDMKAGLAAGLTAAEAHAGDLSLIFLAVCDEEEKSAGARAAATQLKDFAAEQELEIVLVINLDAISDQGDGSTGRVVTFGSIGKQLVTAFVQGKQTHAGYPQDGVNAAYVAAELVTEFELSPLLAETTGAEKAAPPVTLSAKDLKRGYNVTTPGQAWVYWNTMQHRRSGGDVFKLALEHAARAIARAEAKTGHRIALMGAADLSNSDAIQADHGLDLPEQSRRATAAALARMNLQQPSVVIGFGSIPYPAVLMQNQKLRGIIEKAVRPSGLGSVNYFAGISDMSFFGEASGDLTTVAANTLIWGKSFAMPEPAGYPCINIGPWGRDYHHWLERLHAPYAFDTLPRVLLAVIDAVEKSG